MKDVARHAGVSIQSVSNVINGRESQMRGETRERILQTIRELDYQPHSQARALRSHRTNTVAFLTIDPVMRFLASPFHVEVVSGMVETLRLHDYSLFVHGLDPELSGDTFQRLAQQRRFDGAVVHLSGPRERRRYHIERLKQCGYPFVLIEERASSPTAACVMADDRKGAAEAVAYLQDRGHERIGFLSTDRSWPAIEERLKGYREAVRASPHRWNRVWKVDFESVECAGAATEDILRCEPSVTAVLCANDLLAVGSLQAAQRMQRRVPDEFAIIGFNNFEFTTYVSPPLSTVTVPAYEMGRRSASMLLDFFARGSFSAHEIVFPTTLVLRGSA